MNESVRALFPSVDKLIGDKLLSDAGMMLESLFVRRIDQFLWDIGRDSLILTYVTRSSIGTSAHTSRPTRVNRT